MCNSSGDTGGLWPATAALRELIMEHWPHPDRGRQTMGWRVPVGRVGVTDGEYDENVSPWSVQICDVDMNSAGHRSRSGIRD